ncbi:MAG: extracellular solute-binding protein [Anaerolineae bacterium]|nr:extracellular solute-binding protein [Anaerolineae bacterium]
MFTPHVSRLTYYVLRIAYCALLVACANVSPTDTRPLASTTNQPITITLWHSYTDTPAALVQILVNDFHKTYPHITVRVEAKANDAELLRQGLAAIALNRTPDLVIAEQRVLAELARRGALTPLDTLMNDRQHGLRDDARADFFRAC